jgi:hypothetical protein
MHIGRWIHILSLCIKYLSTQKLRNNVACTDNPIVRCNTKVQAKSIVRSTKNTVEVHFPEKTKYITIMLHMP